MIAIGMGLAWVGYGVGFWGWCLVRGYDVPVSQIFSPAGFWGRGEGQSWPPPPIPDGQLFPGGSATTTAAKPKPKGKPGPPPTAV